MHSSGRGGKKPAPRPTGAADAAPPDPWGDSSQLVERVRQGSLEGMEDLYSLVRDTAEPHFCWQFGTQECEDQVHDVYLVVLEAVRGGALRDPRRLSGFVRTVVRYQTLASIRRVSRARRQVRLVDHQNELPDRRATPEQGHLENEYQTLLRTAFGSLSPLDREILVRFYLQDQTKERICTELNLTETQFRLRKSRAKTRFCAMALQKLVPIRKT